MGENSTALKRGWHYDKPNSRMEVWVDGVELMRLKNNVSSASGSAKEVELVLHAESATAGSRQAFYIEMIRTVVMTASDGNPDCGLKIAIRNQTASDAYCRQRCLDINVKADNAGNGSHTVNGAYITAEAESGTTIAGDVIGAEVHAKNGGTCSGSVMCLRVYDESQSGTGTNYAISIDCTNDSAFTREYCVHINSGASSGWTNGITFDGNITNTFDFADNDGTNGATLGTYSSADANPSGHIKVDVGGATRYIYLYTN